MDGEQIDFRREVQTDAMPPRSSLAESDLGPLATSVVADLARFPDDWETQAQAGDGPPPFLYPLLSSRHARTGASSTPTTTGWDRR